MENKFSKIDNKNGWQDLLGKVLFKTFFHSWEWEEFLEKNFKWLKFERYLYQDKAILSLARVKGKLISHPFCEYGGPLPLAGRINGEQFQKDLLAQFQSPFKISFHPKLLPFFEGIKFPENQRETLFLDEINQKSVEEIWRALDRNRHRSINAARSCNLTVKKCESLKELKCLYDFYAKSLKNHKALFYPFSFFVFFFHQPEIKILLAKKGKKIVGGNIFIPYDKILHSFLCGFQEKCRKLGAHSLVLWQAIQEAKKDGYGIFDFGATRKDSSIKDFKTRWGGEVYPIFELKNYTGESKLRDSFLRDVWSYLPTGLVKFLSPRLLKYKL